jgi:hypothetical protein
MKMGRWITSCRTNRNETVRGTVLGLGRAVGCGRVVYEGTAYQYEYNIKDHLGNVRQVLRDPSSQSFMATMETGLADEEEAAFTQLSESRQLGPEHNVTDGGRALRNSPVGRSVKN